MVHLLMVNVTVTISHLNMYSPYAL